MANGIAIIPDIISPYITDFLINREIEPNAKNEKAYNPIRYQNSFRHDRPLITPLRLKARVAQGHVAGLARLTGRDEPNIPVKVHMLPLGIKQFTLARAGRPLLELPTEEDGEEAERLSRTTPAGAELLLIIHELVPKLAAFRDEKKQREKLSKAMNDMIDKMIADLNNGKPSLAALSLEDAIIREVEDCVSLADGFASLEHMEKVSVAVRRVFAKYEHRLKLEKQAARRAAKPKALPTSAAHIDMSAYRKPKPEA